MMPADSHHHDPAVADLCACSDCGLLQRRVPLSSKQVARCSRCDAELYQAPSGSLDRSLALTSAALILFIVANGFPVLGLDVKGRHSDVTLVEAVFQLRTHDMDLLAGLVLFTTVVVPVLEMAGVLFVLAPLKLGIRLPAQLAVYKLIHRLEPWGMIEVYLLGVMVALVKLAHMATIVPGWSLWLLGAFVVVMAAATASLHADEIWHWLAEPSQHLRVDPGATPLRCHDCGWLAPADRGPEHRHCARCGSVLHARKPNSMTRCWALLIAAAILYIPANLLPVMHSSSLGGTQSDTILSGVAYLWVSGSWPLALVVFFASVMVPILKLFSLALLLVSVQLRSRWRPVDRTRLYRVTESIGRWSMVDIFVVTVLVSLVNMRPLAAVDGGPGAIAFGAVVVLTMLAAEAFDPRLIWDAFSEPHDELGH